MIVQYYPILSNIIQYYPLSSQEHPMPPDFNPKTSIGTCVGVSSMTAGIQTIDPIREPWLEHVQIKMSSSNFFKT